MKFKKWLPLLLAGLMTLSVVGFTACDGGNGGTGSGGNQGETPSGGNQGETPSGGNQGQTPSGSTDKWNNESIWLSADPVKPSDPVTLPDENDALSRDNEVSVHDPSIFHDPAKNGYYYAFGTHYAVAKSYDLMSWEQVASDKDWDVLYDDSDPVYYSGIKWPRALDETLKLVQPANKGNDTISTTWAPDVEYYNGKYYMYYSITKAFGSNESAIGRVEADSPTGPYDNNRVILSSVGANASTEPNCIDPELFYDKEGKLWMVYGSFFGGVYIKELYNEGESWGLPKEEEGWGTRLWLNGYEAGVEGPYVFYNATTDYYYLMTSEGDLNTVYNMRVARSKNPDGPYEDITGKDVATTQGKGNKIAGNYKFARQLTGPGFAAMGHNSVIKDARGRYFVVCHVRRELSGGVTGPHSLYVFQLYFNEDGWPVMSPNVYIGEKMGTVTETQVAADYEIVVHTERTGTKNDILWASSVDYTLTADKKITKAGVEVGSWTLEEGFYITLTIDNVEYKGVVAPGFDMYAPSGTGKGLLSITATSAAGTPLWALAK